MTIRWFQEFALTILSAESIHPIEDHFFIYEISPLVPVPIYLS